MSDSSAFRLPTGHDELAVAGLPLDQAEAVLLERCVAAGADPQTAVAAMEVAGPILDVELEATCPQCGTSQPVSFDVQSYLLAALAQERPRLTGEVHVIASTYGWHRDEILDLPRSVRRQHAELIAADRATRA